MKALLVGGGAREHCIAKALSDSRDVELYGVAHNVNPGILALTGPDRFLQLDEKKVDDICTWARDRGIELAVIGLEDPLDAGLPDRLSEVGIPTVGPRRRAARLETSKAYLRDLMDRFNIPGQIEYHEVTTLAHLKRLLESGKQYALKPIGLTAGKGVRVMGEQLLSVDDAVAYGARVLNERIGGESALILEERIVGPEFTLQCFTDGTTLVPMPLVQDYKKAHEWEQGQNTGSMGSYSRPDGLLPFLTEADRDQALQILQRILDAIRMDAEPFVGVMYGQFMATTTGLKLIEINARFGDPEAVNVLPLLENDFAEVCRAIVAGNLAAQKIRFRAQATVCKYVTPPGYGDTPEEGVPLTLNVPAIERLNVHVYFAKVDAHDGTYLTTSSRSVALVGVADSVPEAEAAVASALRFVGPEGRFHVRRDIGTQALIELTSQVLGLQPSQR